MNVNSVKKVRLAKGMMKKEVLERSAGIISEHRLNMIEAGRGWKPRVNERAVLSQILGAEENDLFPMPEI